MFKIILVTLINFLLLKYSIQLDNDFQYRDIGKACDRDQLDTFRQPTHMDHHSRFNFFINQMI